MKISVCAEVEGFFRLASPIATKWNSYEIEVFSKESKRYIRITKPVEIYKEFVFRPHVDEEGNYCIEIAKYEIYKDLMDLLAQIEAVGAFKLKIIRVQRNAVEIKWIPENDKEKEDVPVLSLKGEYIEEESQKEISSSVVTEMLEVSDKYPEAKIPFTYFRIAQNFYYEKNYYFAYLNFFWMLDYCFSNGTFKKKEVIKNFKSSTRLEFAIVAGLCSIKTLDNPLYEDIFKLFEKDNKELSFDNIICHLVDLRGKLAHGSKRSAPLYENNSKLKDVTRFIQSICFWVCTIIITYGFYRDETSDKLISQELSDIKERLGK